MSEFRMPSLGADMKAATLVQWMVEPGQAFKRGDIIAAVETDKGIIDIEIFDDGVLDEIIVTPGNKVPVGTMLATFHTEGEAPTETVTEKTIDKKTLTNKSVVAATATTPSAQTQSRHPVSPAARRRARELNIDVDKVPGTGPKGTVVLEDVERKTGETASGEDGMRRAIATAMAKSKREIPHYYLSVNIDMEATLAWLEQENSKRSVNERLVYAALLLKATALALTKIPELNGFYIENQFQATKQINIGVATSLRSGGLVVPVLHDAANINIHTLMTDFSALVQRARLGHLRGSDMVDATVTVTSLGEQGVDSVLPVIFPPQVAIVGFGSVVERPWSIKGEIVSRRIISASLAADHRVSDGHRGGRFLKTVNQLLQKPELL